MTSLADLRAEVEAAHRALDDFDAPRTEPHFRSPFKLSGRIRSLRSRLVIEANQQRGRAIDAEGRVAAAEAERDAYLKRVDETVVRAQRNEVRALEAEAERDALREKVCGPPADDERRELLCDRCGHEYVGWFAPNPLWNAVIRAHGGDGYGERPERDVFLCPRCFTNLAAERGIATCFVVSDETDVHEQHAAESYVLKAERDSLREFVEAVEPFIRDVLRKPFPWQEGGQVVTWMQRWQYERAVLAAPVPAAPPTKETP